MPPRRDADHMIKLLPGTHPPAQAPYQMILSKLAELWMKLDELLVVSFIQLLKASFRAQVLIQKKKDGSLWIYIDY